MLISRKIALIAIFMLAISALEIAPASAKNLTRGSFGQSISVTKSTLTLSNKAQIVTVTGKRLR